MTVCKAEDEKRFQECGLSKVKRRRIYLRSFYQVSLGDAVTLPQVKQVIKQWTQAYKGEPSQAVYLVIQFLIIQIDGKKIQNKLNVAALTESGKG